MPDWTQFVLAAIAIIFAGTRLTTRAGVLARFFGFGVGWAGVLLLPLVTSLPELVTSLRAAGLGAPDLAAGNLLGSNVFNILVIALVDLLQGRGSLFTKIREGHVLAASLGITLTSVAIMGILVPFPSFAAGRIGFDTLLLIGGYVGATVLLTRFEWRLDPKSLDDVVGRKRDGLTTGSRGKGGFPWRVLVEFILAALVILVAGVALTDAADGIATATGLGRTLVGTTMLAVATGLPEIVTTSTAARMGQLEMAIGNILGANVMNMLVLAVVDLVYPESLLGSIAPTHAFTAVAAILLTSIAITGLIYRSKRSLGWLAYDSILIGIGYLLTVYILFSS